MYSYIPHTEDDIRIMLEKAGAERVSDLFADIPDKVRLSGGINLPDGLSEQEVYWECSALAGKNKALCCFAGAGIYDHIIPAAVNHIIMRPEFYTAYTPYQAEISQGILQAVFEYQTMICRLTGLEVSNASLYDGFTAAAEACSIAVQKKNGADTILVGETVHPWVRKVIDTYYSDTGIRTEIIPAENGRITPTGLKKKITAKTAGVVLQSPNFYGIIEDFSGFSDIIHDSDSLFIVLANPLSLGILKSPGEWGADIAAGEGQVFGLPMNFGGPGVGYMAAKKELLRKLPGRIVGQTLDRDGRKAYVLTLQAREQHIKRERATSNICTNQALAALAVSAFLAVAGKSGIAEMARKNMSGLEYFRKKITEMTPLKEAFCGPYFNEFTAVVPNSHEFRKHMIARGYLPGISESLLRDSDKDRIIFAVTEKRSKKELDDFVNQAVRFYDENPV